MKTLSISIPFKDAYTISVTEYIIRVLNNNHLYSQMYFRPDIKIDKKSEFWHDNIW
jgi:hypothetical protein